MALSWANRFVMSAPKRYPAPLGDTPHPLMSETDQRGGEEKKHPASVFDLIRDGGKGISPSGSDQRRSHIGPSCGTSCFLSIARICNARGEETHV